ncbi:MAG: cysteine methyltransferase [Xanthomonadaceae bacterium]|nr:cysteine methyltransferase [Xanthomonadaceae bacterium]
MDSPGVHQAALAERIRAVVRAIAPGQVAGYGEVARRAGLPGRARLAARVLSSNEDPQLPWHRVVRSDGRIAFPAGSEGFLEQGRRLQAEGVAVVAGRVRMPSRTTSLDEAIWG